MFGTQFLFKTNETSIIVLNKSNFFQILDLSKILVSVLFYSKMKGSDNQEKLVYQIIEDAGNKGTLNYDCEWY